MANGFAQVAAKSQVRGFFDSRSKTKSLFKKIFILGQLKQANNQ